MIGTAWVGISGGVQVMGHTIFLEPMVWALGMVQVKVMEEEEGSIKML
jgi:hypothetical protein